MKKASRGEEDRQERKEGVIQEIRRKRRQCYRGRERGRGKGERGGGGGGGAGVMADDDDE